MKKFAFFDIDDTLVDYTGAKNKSWQHMGKKFFPHIPQETFGKIWNEKTKENWKLFADGKITFQQQRNKRIQSIWAHFGEAIQEEKIKEIIALHVAISESNWKLFPGIKQSLKTLKKKGIRLGVITNGNVDQQERKLKQVGAYDFFEENLILISERLGFSKPDLRVFQHAQKLAKSKPSEIVYFGNEITQDYEPAVKMEWETILVTSPKTIKQWVLEKA